MTKKINRKRGKNYYSRSKKDLAIFFVREKISIEERDEKEKFDSDSDFWELSSRLRRFVVENAARKITMYVRIRKYELEQWYG